MTKVGELYSIIRGFIERGLCGDNAREVSFKTLDAFESAVREDALQQAAIDIARVRSEGVAEGAEQMRETLRTRGQYTQRGDTVLSDYISPMAATRAMIDLFIIPASAFASVQKVRGKPSRALLDELSEICGGEVTYEPSVLAPTKESHDP